MAAYFIVDLDVHDRAGMREYLERVPGTLEKYVGATSFAVARSRSSRGIGSRRAWSCWNFRVWSRRKIGMTVKNTKI
jgi:hypothetical protein